MGTDQEIGTSALRAITYDKAIKQIAMDSYTMMQALSVISSSAWKNFFYRENPDALAVNTGGAVKGIPRGSQFPQSSVQWDKISTTLEKYGVEEFIYWEDIRTNDISVRDRTLKRIAERVVKSVDTQIWTALEGAKHSGSLPTSIQYFSIMGRGWDQASATIIDDLMRAKQKIGEKFYDTSNLTCFVSERDYRSIVKFVTDKGAQWNSVSADTMTNGKQAQIAGVTFVVSHAVTASNALVVVPKVVGNWRENVSLSTTTITDEYIGEKIRAVQLGVVELTDPYAACLIYGTQSETA